MILDMERTSLKFSKVANLIGVKDDKRMLTIIGLVSCLVFIAEVDNLADISALVDLVNELQVPNKLLILSIPRLDLNLIQNKSINFDVLINMEDTTGKS